MEKTLNIIQNWGDVVAIDKPAGWLAIPGRGNKEDVPVTSHILGEILRGSKLREKSPDLFVVHRLDQGTSGVMIFAKTVAAHQFLSGAFENRDVKKTYWCIVKGTPQNQIIDAPLFKIPSKKIKSVVDEKGKPSQTKIKVKLSHGGYSLVEAQPYTGRSHQIRVHLSHIGNPLLGDPLYGGINEALGLKLSYPLLHSQHLEFEWPKGEKREAQAPLSGIFFQVAKSLGILPP